MLPKKLIGGDTLGSSKNIVLLRAAAVEKVKRRHRFLTIDYPLNHLCRDLIIAQIIRNRA